MNINNPLCASDFGNTGFGDCFLEPGKFAGAFQVPSNFQIAESDVAGLQAFLATKIQATIGTRIFPYHNFISLADQSEQVNITTTDYGAKYINRDGFYDLTYRYLKGGVQLHQEIGKNGGSNKFFIFYDDNGVLYGYTAGGVLKGIPVDIFYVEPWKVPTGADQAQYLLRFIINPKYMNKGNLGFIKITSFNLFDILGLQDVSLQLVNLVANVATVKAFSKISQVDLYPAYSANLAAVAAWTARDRTNGANLSITTVVINALKQAWDFTFNSAAYNLLPVVDAVLLKGTAASVWGNTPVSVVGFEAKDELVIEIPGS